MQVFYFKNKYWDTKYPVQSRQKLPPAPQANQKHTHPFCLQTPARPPFNVGTHVALNKEQTQTIQEKTVFIKNRLGLTEGTETMLAQEQRLNQIANNLANVNTTGYKKDDMTFWEMMFKAADNSPRVGKVLKVITDQQQGSAQQTDNPLDFAINGQGFFKIQTPNGIRYTRNGNFTLNNARQLSTADGNLVMGNGGPIVLNNSNINVARDGQISANGQIINKLSIATFADSNNLTKEGNSLFKLKADSAKETQMANPNIQQGYLEGSNVNIIKGMTEMIDLQRSYQAQQKAIQTSDDLDSQSISKVGKLTGWQLNWQFQQINIKHKTRLPASTGRHTGKSFSNTGEN